MVDKCFAQGLGIVDKSEIIIENATFFWYIYIVSAVDSWIIPLVYTQPVDKDVNNIPLTG